MNHREYRRLTRAVNRYAKAQDRVELTRAKELLYALLLAVARTPAQIEGTAARVGAFEVRRGPAGTWSVGEHQVLADLSACSCPDNKFRHRECKHLLALRRWLG